MCDNVIDKVRQRFSIEVIDVKERPDYCHKVGMDEDDFVSRSYIIGKDTIVLGIYESDEQRVASLFHEVGHILIVGDYESQSGCEKEAWKKAVELAMEYNIVFSPNTMMWIDNQVSTYKKEKMGEGRRYDKVDY